METTTSFTRHIIVYDVVAFPNQVVGGRESLLNKGNFFQPHTLKVASSILARCTKSLESFSQLEHTVNFALQLLSFLDILHFTGDGSGMSIYKSSYWSLGPG